MRSRFLHHIFRNHFLMKMKSKCTGTKQNKWIFHIHFRYTFWSWQDHIYCDLLFKVGGSIRYKHYLQIWTISFRSFLQPCWSQQTMSEGAYLFNNIFAKVFWNQADSLLSLYFWTLTCWSEDYMLKFHASLDLGFTPLTHTSRQWRASKGELFLGVSRFLQTMYWTCCHFGSSYWPMSVHDLA